MRHELTPFATWNTRNPLSFFDDFEKDLENMWARPTRSEFFTPAVDLEENEEAYLLSFDIPGVPEKDIHLEVKDGMLKVWGERNREMQTGKYSERSYGRFERTFSLPEDVSQEDIEANAENGVLFVALPKSEKASGPKKIKINSGKGSFLNRLISGKSKTITKEKETEDTH